MSVFETRPGDFSYQYLLLFNMAGIDPGTRDHAAAGAASHCEAAAGAIRTKPREDEARLLFELAVR